MRHSHKVFSFVSVALLAATLALPVSAQQAATKMSIGLIDREKLLTSYSKAESAAADFKKAQDRVQKIMEDGQKQYDEAKNAHKPPAELEGLKRRLETTVDEEMKKLSAKAQALETQLESDVDTAVKAEAAARKIDVVMIKQAVFMGGTDITEGVLKRLTAAAAPVSTGSAAAGNATTK